MGAGRVAGTACMVNETRRPPRWTSYGQVCEISASCPAGASHVPEPSRLYQRAGQPAWSGRRHIHCPLGAGQEPQTQRNRSAAVRRHAFLPVPGRTGRQCGLAAGTHPQRRATRPLHGASSGRGHRPASVSELEHCLFGQHRRGYFYPVRTGSQQVVLAGHPARSGELAVAANRRLRRYIPPSPRAAPARRASTASASVRRSVRKRGADSA